MKQLMCMVFMLGTAWHAAAGGVKNDVLTRYGGSGHHTAAYADHEVHDAKRAREIPIRIYAPEPKNGVFPVIVFSHGLGESRESFGYLGKHLASHGYIIVFITHTESDNTAVREMMRTKTQPDPKKYVLRPEDLHCVIDSVLSKKVGSPLIDGRADNERLALIGQCAGSTTILSAIGLTLNLPDAHGVTFVHPHVKAAVALSPQVPYNGAGGGQYGLYETSWTGIDKNTPLLVMTGTKDFTWVPDVRKNMDLRKCAYDRSGGVNKHLVDITGAEHHAFTESVPYYPAGIRDKRHHQWICAAVTQFLDAYIKKDAHAMKCLAEKCLEAATQGECKESSRFSDMTGAAGGKVDTRSGYDLSSLAAFLDKSSARNGGGCAFILVRSNEVLYLTNFGNFTTNRVVPMASASKWISGAVILALVDEGKLKLDDTASRYMPHLRGGIAGMTIRQMFSHTHGLPEKPEHHRNTALTMKESADLIAAMTPISPPGTALYYSGTGMQLAGYIATLASGKQWEVLFKEKIGGPCEMRHTDYYAFGETKNPNVAGSVRTSVVDYGNFVMMLLNKGVFKGRRVLSEKAVDIMFSNQTGALPITKHPWAGYRGIDPAMGETRYGIGCWLEHMDAGTGKASRASSGGAFGCNPFVDFREGIAGVYMPYGRTMVMDSDGLAYNDAAAVYLELKPILLSALRGEPPPAAPEASASKAVKNVTVSADAVFARLDKDKNGVLSRDEVTGRLAEAFDTIDADADGTVSAKEFKVVMERFQRSK